MCKCASLNPHKWMTNFTKMIFWWAPHFLITLWYLKIPLLWLDFPFFWKAANKDCPPVYHKSVLNSIKTMQSCASENRLSTRYLFLENHELDFRASALLFGLMTATWYFYGLCSTTRVRHISFLAASCVSRSNPYLAWMSLVEKRFPNSSRNQPTI